MGFTMTAPEREALVKALREALEWAIPMAAIALENHRYDRIKNGHNGDITFVKENGERWVGLFQNEYDALLKARAALSIAPAVTVTEGWKPIESAPKDGEHVIVATGEMVGEARFYTEDGPDHEGWYWADQHWTDAVGGEPFYPTHWQPLPPPPPPSTTPQTGSQE